MNTELLDNALKQALEGIEPQHGLWTITGISSCTANVGKVELKSGKIALVQITIQADQDEIQYDCDDIDSLPDLTR